MSTQAANLHPAAPAYVNGYDPHAAGRLVMLLAVSALLQHPDSPPDEAVARTADEIRVAIGQEGAAAIRRAGRDQFAQEQVAFAVTEMLTVLEIAEPLAVDELRGLQREQNPKTPQGKAALHAWIGDLVGSFGGGLIGLLVGSVAAAGGATGAGVAITGLGAWIGGALGARHAVGRATGIPAKELRETKNYATFGALLMPWFGLGSALGGYLGAAPNPGSPAHSVLLATPWTRSLLDAWKQTPTTTAGDMASSVIDTAHALGWSDAEIIANPRGAMDAAVEIWNSKPTESGWPEPEYIENPRAWNPTPVTVRVSLAGGGTRDVPAEQVTPHMVVHPSIRTGPEVEMAARGKASSWGVTHGPTGALVATVMDQKWAKKLAQEIERTSGPGIGTLDVVEAQRAIGGPGMRRAQYISHVSRQSGETKKDRGKFPRYEKWAETAHELDENPRNPEDHRADAAVGAAVGNLVGAVVGAVLGAVVLGGVGALGGAAAFGSDAVLGGVILGGIYGIPLGAFIGSIWGAVRQTGKAMAGAPGVNSAKFGAAAGSLILPGPLGAGLGAYLGAPA